MDKKTSLLTKNAAFEHKLHFDRRKCAKGQNGRPIHHNFRRKKQDSFGQKQLDLE
jgi:hypothetical protein